MNRDTSGNSKGRYYSAFFIALLTFVVYLPALRNEFVNWDDGIYVYNNPNIRSFDWTFIRWAFTDMSTDFWLPFTWISHAIDYAVWGKNPVGHHLSSVLLHALNTFLVIHLIMRLLDVLNRDGRNGSLPFLNEREIMMVGGITGILFGLHPLRVESVAWVAERKDLLYSLFYLSSIVVYIDHARALEKKTPQNLLKEIFSGRYYYLSLALFVFALSSKPMAVTLPAVLLILDWYPLERLVSPRKIVQVCLEKLPYLVLSLIVSVAAFLAQKASGAVIPLGKISLADRLLMAAQALVAYLWKMAVPVHLLPFYPLPEKISFLSIEYLLPLTLVFGITAACVFLMKKQKILLAVWGYYLVTLMPVLGLVRVGTVSMADRFTYLPSLGPFLIMAVGLERIWKRVNSRWGITAQRFISVAVFSLVIALSYVTLKQISIWKNSMTLWSYIIEKEPARVPLAYNNRGLVFQEKGQPDRAIADFNAAIALNPNYSHPYTNRGMAFEEIGEDDRALDDFNRAITLDPNYADVYSSRALLLKKKGQLDRAIKDFTTAITLHPHDVIVYIDRGLAFKEMGMFERAVADYDVAIRINPDCTEAYNNRGVAYKHLGRFERALSDYDKAIALNPSFYLAYMNRGVVFAMIGQSTKAAEDFTKALSLKPDLVSALIFRGESYLKSGDTARAATDFQRACDMGDNNGCAALNTIKGLKRKDN